MAANDDLEDVELNYLRNQALSSRQNTVPYQKYPTHLTAANAADVSLDADIFKPTGGGGVRSDKEPPTRQTRKRQTPPSIESFNKRINSKQSTKQPSSRARRSPSSSSSTTGSSYSSQYSYSSSRSGSGSRSSSRSLSGSRTSSSQSTYSTASNESTSPVRRRSRSPLYHHEKRRGEYRRATPPHQSHTQYDRPSRSRRHAPHHGIEGGRLVGEFPSSRYPEHPSSRRHYRSPSPRGSNRSRNIDYNRGRDRVPPPHSRRGGVSHRSPQWRSPPPHMSRRSPPPNLRRSPPPRRVTPPPMSRRRSPGRLHPSPRSPPPIYKDSPYRGRRHPDIVHSPPPRGPPSRRRHSLTPPRAVRRRLSPPSPRHRSPIPPQRRIRVSPPSRYSLSPPPPGSRRMRDHEGNRRKVVMRSREHEDWAEHRMRDPPIRHRPRDKNDERLKRERELQSREALEQWRKRKREERELRNGEKSKRSRKMSPSLDRDDNDSKDSSNADEHILRDDDTPSSLASDFTGRDSISTVNGDGTTNPRVAGGRDVLDEELDYDETMEDIELYLREDDEDQGGVLKSEVVSRRASRMSESSMGIPAVDKIHSDTKSGGMGLRPESSKSSKVAGSSKTDYQVHGDNTDSTQDGGQTTADLQEDGDQSRQQEEGQIMDEPEDDGDGDQSAEEGEVLLQSSDEEVDGSSGEVKEKTDEDPQKTESEDETCPSQPIKSPIRLTPEPNEGGGGARRRKRRASTGNKGSGAAGGGEGQRRDEENKPRLPVRDRLYISKTDIERKAESINYRQSHKLSSDLARRLGPPSDRPRKRGGGGGGVGGDSAPSRGSSKSTSSRGDAKTIAEEFRKKNTVGSDEVQREKRRISKLLLNDQYSKKGNSTSHRSMKHNEVDLDQKISKIRHDDQKRLMRQEEVRKDRQRYG